MEEIELKQRYKILFDYLVKNRDVMEQRLATEDLRLICAFLREIQKICESAMIGAVDKRNNAVSK